MTDGKRSYENKYQQLTLRVNNRHMVEEYKISWLLKNSFMWNAQREQTGIELKTEPYPATFSFGRDRLEKFTLSYLKMPNIIPAKYPHADINIWLCLLIRLHRVTGMAVDSQWC